jgi:hypothetical protein
MTVLEVNERKVIVRTPRAAGGTAIPIAWVQRGINALLRTGSVEPTSAGLGRRCEFISTVLMELPGATRSAGSGLIVLERPARRRAREIRARVDEVRSAPGAWPVVLLASCAAVAVTTFVWPSSPARALVTTWFLLVCPGMSMLRVILRRDRLTLWVLAVATSLALETLLAEAMLETGIWSPRAILGLLLAFTIGGSVAQLVVLRAPEDRTARPEVRSLAGRA